MRRRSPRARDRAARPVDWMGALFVAAGIAAALPTGRQVGYAAAVLGVLGLPPRRGRPGAGARRPPRVGFAVAFVVLHARDQTMARRRMLGLPGLAACLRRVAPVLAGAVLALAGLAMIVPPSPAGVRMLFVAISALAMPHMLVTPLWTRRRGSRGIGRGLVMPSVAR